MLDLGQKKHELEDEQTSIPSAAGRNAQIHPRWKGRLAGVKAAYDVSGLQVLSGFARTEENDSDIEIGFD